jgi:hypothetical protein
MRELIISRLGWVPHSFDQRADVLHQANTSASEAAAGSAAALLQLDGLSMHLLQLIDVEAFLVH